MIIKNYGYMGEFSIKYELVKFERSNDPAFQNAIKIYLSTTPHDQKTNSSEIVQWVDEQSHFKVGELFFFGLKVNDVVVGYAELAYVKKDRILIIDYINLEKSYRSNSNFYAFYTLIIDYINKKSIDYDYITKEILCRYNETHIHKEDVSLYELENFKVVNGLYIQPQLERNNVESSKESLIMLYTRAGLSPVLKKDEYLHIVEVIYDYYYCWDKPFLTDEERKSSRELAQKNLNVISENISAQGVTLNGYPFTYSTSTNGTGIPSKNKNVLMYGFLNLFMFVVLFLIVIYLLYLFKLNLKYTIILLLLLLAIYLASLVILDRTNIAIVKKLKDFFVSLS